MKKWYTYILRCNDGSLYTGITTDIKRRLHEHNCTKAGARYCKIRRPVVLVYYDEFDSRSGAQKEECRIKKLDKQEKELIVIANMHKVESPPPILFHRPHERLEPHHRGPSPTAS